MIHFVIPDTQVKPGVKTDHLRWVGQYIVDKFHDLELRIIHLGDHADMESLSSYDKGKRAMEGRRYEADIRAANEGFKELCWPIDELQQRQRSSKSKVWQPERHFLLGNHEDRITRATEDDAVLHGTLSLDHLDYGRRGWEVHPYLSIAYLDGVAYSHFFYNPMTGRPYGGLIDTRLKNIGHSFTMGHQQTLLYGVRYVAGRSQHGLVAGSCYLHDEGYKGPQGNNHWRGVVVCHEVGDGSYDPMFVSLDFLCRKYEGVTLDTWREKNGC